MPEVRHPAPSTLTRSYSERVRARRAASGTLGTQREGLAVEFRQRRAAIDAEHLLHRRTRHLVLRIGRPVGDGRHHRGELAVVVHVVHHRHRVAAALQAFAGLGLYSEHRWKLPYTSRGLLATAVLLVPLNFLAIAALSNDQSGNKILAWGGVLSAFFGLLIFRSGRVLAPTLAAPLTAGLLIPSFTELLIRKFEVPGELAYGTIIISAVLVVSYHLVTIWVLRSEGILLKERLFVFGSISFASILSFCFLLLRTEIFSESLHRLGPIVCLFATPAVLLGAWMWNQVKAEAFENVAGTALSVLGFGVLAVGFLFSWQACGNLLLASLICAGVSFLAAHFTGKWGFRLAGLFLLSLAWTVGANLAFGRIKPDSGETVLLEAVVSTFSAGAIAIFTVILAGVYEYLNSHGRKDQSLLIGMSLLSLGALFLALEGGFGQLHDPHHITWILGLLTLEAYYLAYRFEEKYALPAGIAIGLLAWLQLVHFVFGVRPDVSVLSYASLVLIVTGVLRKRLSSGLSQLFAITDWSLVGITLIGAFTVIGKMDSGWKTFGVSVWLGLIWLALGLLLNLYPGFVLFQAAFIFGIFSKNPDKADFALWLAVFAAVWSVLRTVVRRRLTIVDESEKPAGSLLRMLMWENLTLDQVASALLLGTLLLSHSWGLLTAVDQIKTVGGTPTFSFALGASATKSWLTIAVLAVAFITGLWDRFNKLAALCSYALLVSAGFTLLTVLKLEPPKAVLAGGGVICAVAALGLIALSERFRLEEKLAALEIRRPSESWWTASVFALLLVTLLGTALAGVLNFSSLAYRLGAAGEVAVAGILLVRTVSKFGVAGRYAFEHAVQPREGR